MTGFAKRHQIIFVMSSSFFEREDMVDFLCRGELVVLQTLLAQGIGFDVSVSYLPPSIPISFAAVVAALVLVVS